MEGVSLPCEINLSMGHQFMGIWWIVGIYTGMYLDRRANLGM